MSQTTTKTQKAIFAGKSSFAFSYAIKRATEYLRKNNLSHQISFLPATYPKQPRQLSEVDVAAKAKILKAHLEDAFAQNRFSVEIERNRKSAVIHVSHDCHTTITTMTQDDEESILAIIRLYLDDSTRHKVKRFV